MSARGILAELPRLSPEERALVAETLRHLGTGELPPASPSAGQPRCADLHAGAWEIAADFAAPLSDAFWLGEDA